MSHNAYVYWLHLKDHDLSNGYIGVARNHKGRYRDHLQLLETEKHDNIHLVRAYKKYGKDNISCSILLRGSEEYCYQIENRLRPVRDIGWNIAEGGDKPPIQYGNSWNVGKKFSEEHRANIAKNSYLVLHYNGTVEQKRMLSKKLKGVPRPWTAAMGRANKGKRMGDENPAKREEVRKIISEKKKLWWAQKKLLEVA